MQHKPSKNWDNLLKSKFENLEIIPSEKIWDNIEGELKPKKRKHYPIFWSATAAILLVSSVLFVNKYNIKLVLKPVAKIVQIKKIDIIKSIDTLMANNKIAIKKGVAVLEIVKKPKLKKKNNYNINIDIETNKSQYIKPNLTRQNSYQNKTEPHIMAKDSIVLAVILTKNEAI